MANKKKLATSVVAVATAAAVLLGGTFAWQSISQTALNEASDVVNPGGRLHDDFDGTNKDVYVENFADENIYARVRLEEYFEITMNKGTAAEKTEIIVGGETETYSDDGTKITDDDGNPVMEKTYEVFTAYESTDTDTGIRSFDAAVGEDDISWWTWTTGGETVYMPTFNMNKDSLAADVNGTYAGPDGTDGVTEDDDADRYDDYYEYSGGEIKDGTEIYDADTNNVDEVGSDFSDANIAKYVTAGNITTVAVSEAEGTAHTAKETLPANLISMSEWLDMVEYDDDGNVTSAPGDYWVYDEDGWVYWSSPIEPDTATGLLLDAIELNQVMDDTWYYAINVVAQFVTADDLGSDADGTGFYDPGENNEYSSPTDNALVLLAAIGVDTSSATDDSDEENEEEEEDWSARSIVYDGRNGTIWVSDASVFVSGGAGVSFTLYDAESGMNADSTCAEWSLASNDNNTYTGTENTDENDYDNNGKYFVTVDKSADEISEGDTFEFTVYGKHLDYGDTVSAEITVVIGDRPIMFFDESEVTMGEENYIWAEDYEGYADSNYIAVGDSGNITLNGTTTLANTSYLEVTDRDYGEIKIDLTNVSNDEIKIGDTLTFTVDLKNYDSGETVGSITHTVTVVQAPPKVLVNGYEVDNVLASETYKLTADGETEGWTFEITDGEDYASISGTTLTVGSDSSGSFTVKATHTSGRTGSKDLNIAKDWTRIAKVVEINWEDCPTDDTELTTMAADSISNLYPVDTDDEIYWDDVTWSVEDTNGNKLTEDEHGIWMNGGELCSNPGVADNGAVTVYVVATDPNEVFTEQRIKATIEPRPYFTLTDTSTNDETRAYIGYSIGLDYDYSAEEKKSFTVTFSENAEVTMTYTDMGWYSAPTLTDGMITFPINDATGGSNRFTLFAGDNDSWYADVYVTVYQSLSFEYVLNDMETDLTSGGTISCNVGDTLQLKAVTEGGNGYWTLGWYSGDTLLGSGETCPIDTSTAGTVEYKIDVSGSEIYPATISFTLNITDGT